MMMMMMIIIIINNIIIKVEEKEAGKERTFPLEYPRFAFKIRDAVTMCHSPENWTEEMK